MSWGLTNEKQHSVNEGLFDPGESEMNRELGETRSEAVGKLEGNRRKALGKRTGER